MHKDQKIVRDSLIPALAERVAEGDPVAERDCTILARMLRFGPDPLFLMETCPNEFADLCSSLGLNVDDGRQAIESAHWQGPGVLLAGEGLPAHLESYADMPEAWRREALWLVLASMSDCTEDGYGDEVSMVKRLQVAFKSATRLSRFALGGRPLLDVMLKVEAYLRTFKQTTYFTPDPLFGKPMTADKGHGFYVGFKVGHPCVAVQVGSLIFYGTVPGTTLEDESVAVDKPLSPQFGIVFGQED